MKMHTYLRRGRSGGERATGGARDWNGERLKGRAQRRYSFRRAASSWKSSRGPGRPRLRSHDWLPIDAIDWRKWLTAAHGGTAALRTGQGPGERALFYGVAARTAISFLP